MPAAAAAAGEYYTTPCGRSPSTPHHNLLPESRSLSRSSIGCWLCVFSMPAGMEGMAGMEGLDIRSNMMNMGGMGGEHEHEHSLDLQRDKRREWRGSWLISWLNRACARCCRRGYAGYAW